MSMRQDRAGRAVGGRCDEGDDDVTTTIEGPVDAGTRGRPWSLPLADLANRGYVAEELFLAGTATAYRSATELTPDGRWDLEPDGTADFRTRVLVVRPSDPAASNGTAVVSWLNVTAGYELGTADDDELLSGYTWIGVSAQKVGIDGFPPDAPRYRGRQAPMPHLKAWDPERYGSLVHPGDRYSFDLFSQAGRAARDGKLTGPVRIERVIATGASQSGARLTSYANGVHPLDPVFDAFVPTITGGWGTRFEEVAGGGTSAEDLARRMLRTKLRDDLDVPVLVVNSECEAVAMYPTRRPDGDRFRFWEVAGAPHVVAVAPPETPREAGRIDNPLTYRPVLSAGFRAVHRWLTEGVAPPSMPRIEMAEPGSIVRDALGNAVGGVRLPEMAAPIAEYHGRDDDAAGLLTLYGWARPFDHDELRRLYGSRQAYADAFRTGVAALVDAGGLRKEDADGYAARADEIAADLLL
jgi:hypothetical protein